ncbi:SDR family oxidoreductase [Sphingomonas endophytica]|uniref:NAD(P)-dependent dehydrogenase (Short-subunit alcohol dehydrogenase family) n=1 Tax=Sphingomonas endophytica TaxID=869719 RepID=A0A7X0JE93_9SPHN|nr:SDR family oxidoreductase [Sphingomonas endophytica]MBB5726001.1 NAD(P)-dependent dehydrogenase (short-subunit alcohol dehydrogenase family) [Sphingomonas endophytica]MBB6506018.1 NAD(P)-dependent dehydrogenase (short-subunit alcohol dehydrogenase family) [Sphingomonas endophytica]
MKAMLVTGGGSGIGRAVAQVFSARGWRVGLADIDAQGLRDTAALLPADRTSTHVMDVRDPSEWEEVLADFAHVSDGRLDLLFNNAGIAAGGPFAEIGLDAIDRVIDINFRGLTYGARMAYPYLKATPGACLLNTASASAIYGSAGLAIYSATKFAVRGLTEALDGEWAAEGIRVRSLMPSFIDTNLLSAPIPGTKYTARDLVVRRKLEFTPVETVAEKAWAAVHGDRVHTVVGKTAERMAFAARWMPGRLRAMMRGR